MITPCNHRFHVECIKKWADMQNKCPLCKARFTKFKYKKNGKECEEEVSDREENFYS